MSARDKVSCFECDAKIILKNLKVHYQRFHPSKPVKHRSINEKCVDKLFSTLKRKPEEENADGIPSKKLDIERTSTGKSVEIKVPLDEHFTNSSTATTSLHEDNSVIENDNQNEDSVSVNKDVLNKILLSIQGKTFLIFSLKILNFYHFNLK